MATEDFWADDFWIEDFWDTDFWGAPTGVVLPTTTIRFGRVGVMRFSRTGRLRFAASTMSIAHLLDHTMRVWRPVETRGTANEIIRTYELVYPSLACAVNRQMTALITENGGLVPAGIRRVYLDVGPVINERDVIELLSGPEFPAKLEVEAPSKPRGHHIELGVSEFKGKLPAVPVVS